MPITSAPANPGDLKNFVVTINGKNVSAACHTVDVYQDIYTPTWSAQFFFEDSANLLTILPIRAGQEIKVKVETNFGGFKGDGEKEFNFIIYRIGDKTSNSQAGQTYTIFAADKAFLKNQKNRVSRSFRNQSPESIAQLLVQEELGGGTVLSHPADDNVSCIVPNWTPFNSIGWLQKVSTHENAADYCFFQIDDDKFAFKSFEKMFSSDDEKVNGITFRQRPANILENGNHAEDFTENIQEFRWQHFDGMSGMAAGLYKSKTVSYDLINKKWESKTFTFGDDTGEDANGKNFEGEDLVGEDTNVTFMPKHSGMYDGGSSHLDSIDKWVGSRKSAVQKMDSERLTIQISGAAKSWEWIGKNVQVELPAQEDMTGELLDKTRKGNYVIVAICHNIKKTTYMTNIEMIKKRIETTE